MFCGECGKEIPDGIQFCKYCGAALPQIGQMQNNVPRYREDVWRDDSVPQSTRVRVTKENDSRTAETARTVISAASVGVLAAVIVLLLIACRGYIDRKEEQVIITDEFDTIVLEEDYSAHGDFCAGRAVVRDEAGDWGYINEDGKEEIDCQYKDASDFSENGLAAVCNQKDKWGFIDQDGRKVIPFQYQDVGRFAENGLAAVFTEDQKWHYIDESGETVIAGPYTGARAFAENGLAAVRKADGGEENAGSKWGFIDQNGKEVIPCIYDRVQSFSTKGLAAVAMTSEEEGSKWGFVDESGKEVIPLQYEEVSSFGENGLAAVRTFSETSYSGLGWSFINTSGTVLNDITFDDIEPAGMLESDVFSMGYGKDDSLMDAGWLPFSSGGVAAVERMSMNDASRWGYINESVETAIPFMFSSAGSFSEKGIAVVQTDHTGNGWGCIDEEGRVVLPFVYTELHTLDADSDILAWAEKRG